MKTLQNWVGCRGSDEINDGCSGVAVDGEGLRENFW